MQSVKMITVHLICLSLVNLLVPCAGGKVSGGTPADYNVVWDSPSKDYNGSMPLGNGEIGLNVWMEQNGDLVFYIGRTDSWGDNARLLKVGKVRVSLSPNPLVEGAAFEQALVLENGEIVIKISDKSHDTAGEPKTVLRIWVDANHPVIHVAIKGHKPFKATARIDLWRTERYTLPAIEMSDVHYDRDCKPDYQHSPTIVEPDTVLRNQRGRVGWYHHNSKSIGPALSMKIQGLSDYKMEDPLLHRTFGAVVTTEKGKRVDDLTLTTRAEKKQMFNIYVMTEHPASPQQWLNAVDAKIAQVESLAFGQRRQSHLQWWRAFWNRSWIQVQSAVPTNNPDNDAFVVSRAYALQRFINACAGRGRYPIRFNGSIFTVPHPGRPGDADFHAWGPGYWWQNSRLPYLGMCMSGDFDMMKPLFRMYGEDIFELCKYRTRHYFGYEGAYFVECMYFWGAVFNETYGWKPYEQRQDKLQTSRAHKWEWVAGPELAGLMLDYYDHTGDTAFLREKVLPLARQVMLFFENYYKTGSDGKLIMHPSQAIETWWECTNPMPEVAGLRALSRRVLALPTEHLTDNERRYWRAARAKIPELPTREVNGVRMLAPAQKFARKSNTENPELYAVFPFRQIALGKPNIELGIEALKHRWDKGDFGWRQDDIFMAYLGLANQARETLVRRTRKHRLKGARFAAFWGPWNWGPDQDHGGVLMKVFQSMLMQTDGRKIYLLPAWPRDWNVDFKLHAPYQTTVVGTIKDGEIKDLGVTPEVRRKDIVIMKCQ